MSPNNGINTDFGKGGAFSNRLSQSFKASYVAVILTWSHFHAILIISFLPTVNLPPEEA